MSIPPKHSSGSQQNIRKTLNEKYWITTKEINSFLAKYFTGRNREIKAILKDFKNQELSSWFYIIWSKDFRKYFATRLQIENLPSKDIMIFEELMIMIPLNYIYWRDGVMYEDIFPATHQKGGTCWAHAFASCLVLAYRRIIGRDKLDFEEVKNYLIEHYDPERKGQNVNILPEIVRKYGLQCEKVDYDDLNLFNPNGSYSFYICTFFLNGQQWNCFSSFFDDNNNNKDKSITPEDLKKTEINPKFDTEPGGHAVILIEEDDYSLTFLNSWGKNWANNGKFSVSRDAIKMIGFQFYSVYWYDSDLNENEKLCYKNRRKKAVEAFYQILDYTNLLSSNLIVNSNDVINMVKENQNDEIKKDILMILNDFCQDFWKPGKESDFRAQKLPSVITIYQFNSLELKEQIDILEKIIKLNNNQRTDFLIKIKNVLNYFQNKEFISKAGIEIVNNGNIKLYDINKELEVQFSPYAIKGFYENTNLNFDEFIDFISKFSHFNFDLIYPHQFFQAIYDQLLNIKSRRNLNFTIRLYIKKIQDHFDNSILSKLSSSIRLDSSFTTINNYIFCSCQSLVQITIPHSVTSIGYNAFEKCSSLEQIRIPSSINIIKSDAFAKCSLLKEVIFDNSFSLTSIGKGAFRGCSSLEKIQIPSSIIKIEDSTFSECSSLKHISFETPSSIETIGESAFKKCTSLNKISFPSSVISIGQSALDECTSLTEITISSFKIDTNSMINVDDYEIVNFISEGSKSIIFHAINKRTKKHVAFKVFKENYNCGLIDFFNLLRISQFSFPGIVNMIGFRLSNLNKESNPKIFNFNGKKIECDLNGSIIISDLMETCDIYQNTQEYLKMNGDQNLSKMNPTIRSKIIFGVAATMKKLHDKYIIYKHLNINNVYLNNKFEPQIRIFNDSEFTESFAFFTDEDYAIDAPRYVAPECITDLNEKGLSVDVYSYAIFLYDMFSTIITFSDLKPIKSSQQFLSKINNGARPIRPKFIPNHYWDLIQKCWKQDPNDRLTFKQIVDILLDDRFALEEFGMKTDLKQLHEYQKRINS